MLSVGVGILAYAMSGSNAANRDFICYWAAGHQLVHHRSPYDGSAILELERTAGFTDPRPFFMRNPPSALLLALPLGFVSAKTGAVLWSLALVAALMASIRMLWVMHGRPAGRLHLIGYLFPPVLACLLSGQIGIFLLFGITAFLFFEGERPFIAGAALFLCLMKPLLFFPCGVVFAIWLLRTSAYRILAGLVAMLALSSAIPIYLDPQVWPHYFAMAKAADLGNEFIPTVSQMLRLLIHRDALWIQVVPVAGASLCALFFYWKHRREWAWRNQGPLLVVMSVLTAPYAWFTDEAVVLPAVLSGLYRLESSNRSLLPFGMLAAFALVQVLMGAGINSGFYLWTAPAWAIWYWYSLRPEDVSTVTR